MRRRVERLKGLAGKFAAESDRMAREHDPLTWAEQQRDVKGIREAADGLQRAHLVLADALMRVGSRLA